MSRVHEGERKEVNRYDHKYCDSTNAVVYGNQRELDKVSEDGQKDAV